VRAPHLPDGFRVVTFEHEVDPESAQIVRRRIGAVAVAHRIAPCAAYGRDTARDPLNAPRAEFCFEVDVLDRAHPHDAAHPEWHGRNAPRVAALLGRLGLRVWLPGDRTAVAS
jgi:hypothetical protein